MYPKWLYNKETPRGKIFNDALEEVKAGEGWVDSPDKIYEQLEEETPLLVAPVDKPAPKSSKKSK